MGHVVPTINDHTWQRLVFPGLIVLAALSFIGGGTTVDVTPTDELLQLVALPVLVVAVAAFAWRAGSSRLERMAVAVAVLIACIPLLQLMPLPAALWSVPAPRDALAADLAQAGVVVKQSHWSLMPSNTERSLWALLPALACFLAALQLTDRQVRKAMQVVLGLVLANIAFAFFQVAVPPDSALRLYSNNGAGFGGVLLSSNHQATALIVGMLVALGLAADTRLRAKEGRGGGQHAWIYAVLSLVCFASILLAGSSAGLILGMLFFAAGCLALASWSRRSQRGVRLQRAGGLLAIVLALTGGFWAMSWMDLAQTEPLRYAVAKETWRLGGAHFPWGSGIGTFVPVFGQSAPTLLQADGYINHAHNEFAQWWMTGGLPAMLALAAALALLLAVGALLLRHRRRNALGISCWLAVVAVLAHSWVDYPLRTLSLMSMTALLAGLAVATASRALPTKRSRRDGALQPA